MPVIAILPFAPLQLLLSLPSYFPYPLVLSSNFSTYPRSTFSSASKYPLPLKLYSVPAPTGLHQQLSTHRRTLIAHVMPRDHSTRHLARSVTGRSSIPFAPHSPFTVCPITPHSAFSFPSLFNFHIPLVVPFVIFHFTPLSAPHLSSASNSHQSFYMPLGAPLFIPLPTQKKRKISFHFLHLRFLSCSMFSQFHITETLCIPLLHSMSLSSPTPDTYSTLSTHLLLASSSFQFT